MSQAWLLNSSAHAPLHCSGGLARRLDLIQVYFWENCGRFIKKPSKSRLLSSLPDIVKKDKRPDSQLLRGETIIVA